MIRVGTPWYLYCQATYNLSISSAGVPSRIGNEVCDLSKRVHDDPDCIVPRSGLGQLGHEIHRNDVELALGLR
jgi:hypothetical protein